MNSNKYIQEIIENGINFRYPIQFKVLTEQIRRITIILDIIL